MGENFMNPNMPVPPSTGFEGLPFADNPLGQLMYGKVGQQMQASGFMPLGFSGQNIADQARNQKFLQMHNDLMVRASLADRENYLRTIQGTFRAFDAEFGQEQRQATIKALDAMLPYAGLVAAAAPEMLEWAGGPRGSQAVMAQKMIMGSRFRFDPVSGRLGMGKESIESMLDVAGGRVSQDDISHLRGFTAGQMGDMSQFLLSKGLLAGGGVGAQKAGLRGLSMTGDTALGKKLDRMGIDTGDVDFDAMSPSQLREITGDREIREQMRGDPGAVKRMRKFDSQRVNRSIESYLDAASAMGEFLGTPNKGIGELMSKLEEMVGPSAMAQLSPQRIAGLVRQTSEMAKLTGVVPATAVALQQSALNTAARMGLQGFQGIQVAQHAMGFAGALRARGLAPTWGQLSAGQATALDIQLTASAARSEVANRLGAFARMSEAMGGFHTDEARLLMKQLETGTLTDAPDRQRMAEILGAEGIDEAQMSAFFSQQFSNQRLIQKHNIGVQVRDMQGKPVRESMARAINFKMGNLLRDTIGLKEIPAITQKVIDNIMDMTDEEIRNPGDVNQVIVETLQESLGQEVFEERFGTGPAGIVKARLFADEFRGGLEERLQKDEQIGGARTIAGVRTMHDPRRLEKGRQIAAAARVRGVVTQALQPLGRGNFVQRLIGALQTSETGDISDIIGRTLGTAKPEVRAAVLKAFEKLEGPMKELADLERLAETETNPAKRASIIKEAQSKQEALGKTAAAIARDLEIKGINIERLQISDEEKAKIKEEEEKKRKEDEALAAKDPAIRDTTEDGDARSKAERTSGAGGVNVHFPDKLAIEGELTQLPGNRVRLKGNLMGIHGPSTK